MWSLCRNHYTSNRYQGGLQLDLIKIFFKLKAIFVKENLRFKTLIYISFSYIKSLSDFYHYGESWRRSGNTHPRASIKTTLGVLPETKAASLRSRAIVSQERIRVYSYACFG